MRHGQRAAGVARMVMVVTVVMVLPGGGGWSSPVGAQAPETEGARLFRTNCASCHGTTGQGNGPVAGLLRRRVADLTQIAAANGGTFPAARVHRIIDGRDVESHGVPEMPVWGDAFTRTTNGSAAAVQARIAALVRYLESIQRRNAQ